MEDKDPGVPQSLGSQRVGHNLVTEQQQQQHRYLKGCWECPNLPRPHFENHAAKAQSTWNLP